MATAARSVALAVMCAAALIVTAWARADVPQGTTPLLVALTQRNLDKLEKVFWEVSNPDSPRYGKYLSEQDIARIVAPDAGNVALVRDWLAARGAVGSADLLPTGDYLIAHVPRDAASGIIRASRDDPALASVVDLVVRADPSSLRLHAELDAAAAAAAERPATSGEHKPSGKPRPLALGDPATQRTSYGIPTGLRGTNAGNRQMVWGPGTYGILDSDLSSFYGDFQINEPLSLIHRVGFAGTPGGDNFGEATLDASYVTGIGQGVPTYVANTNKSMSTEEGDGFGSALLHFTASLASGNSSSLPRVLSISLGSLTYESCHQLCEGTVKAGATTYKQCWSYMQQQRQVCMFLPNQIPRTSTEFMKIGLRGVTVVAASGDGGSHYSFQPFNDDPIGQALNTVSCAKNWPTYPASDPYVTGVGGTQWDGAPSQPTPWSASGGGFSWTFDMPDYQKAAVGAYMKANTMPPSSAFNAAGRAYPDIAALASGVPMVVDGNFVVAGGTSASAPEIGGLFSLLNDHRMNNNLPPLGFVNPRLYKVAAAHPNEAFYTMSSGSSACTSAGSCCPASTSFPAAGPYDPITGLGSPIWAGLVKYLGQDS